MNCPKCRRKMRMLRDVSNTRDRESVHACKMRTPSNCLGQPQRYPRLGPQTITTFRGKIRFSPGSCVRAASVRLHLSQEGRGQPRKEGLAEPSTDTSC